MFDKYLNMSLEELRLLGTKELIRIADELIVVFDSMAQVYDEPLDDWLEELEELYTRIAPRKNDILLAKNGTTGVCAIVETDEVFDIFFLINSRRILTF